MEVFDRLIPDFIDKYDIPGGAVAIVKDGRLVFARGYGLADIGNAEPVQPDSLFRIASLSKPITAAAILTLVEDGKLDLDEKAFEILGRFKEPEGTSRDPRIDEVTVRQLLHHSGGWDSGSSYDPMWSVWRTGRGTDARPPITCRHVIHYMLGQPLDFDPGTRYAYSNFGYCVLGRVIEEKTGQEYEHYVLENVLKPLGINRMRIGGTLLEDRIDGEVKYYSWEGQDLAWSVFSEGPSQVPWPYGGFYLKGQDAHGGWLASTVDMVRFVSALDGSRPPTPLEPETVDLMLSRHDPPLTDTVDYYGLGWGVRLVNSGSNWSHLGSQPGNSALLVRSYRGLTWAVLFNSRPRDFGTMIGELDRLMWTGVEEVPTWPSHDLFPNFGYE